ncbi:hypothetical protein ACA611_17405, partial [Lactiplantibacillus plantarum]|uniref:hypothetical protein n=1 Tax=Lactiplantibacillus plantarum TaxID=1590 RepID=UPI003C242EBF
AHVASCGLGAIPIGETLLVWAAGSDGSYSSTWCALPSDAEDDVRAQLTREVGEPADLTDIPLEPIEKPMSPVATVGLVLGGLAALGIGLAALA